MTAQPTSHCGQRRSHAAVDLNTSPTTPTRAPVPVAFYISGLRGSGVESRQVRSKWVQRVVLGLSALMVGCTNPPGTGNSAVSVQNNEAQSAAADTIDNLTIENSRLRRELSEARTPPAPTPTPEDNREEPVAQAASTERCLRDYCPCEESGTVDRMLCRNMRAGLPVDDTLLASGAAQRDLREYMRRWNRDNPSQAVPVED